MNKMLGKFEMDTVLGNGEEFGCDVLFSFDLTTRILTVIQEEALCGGDIAERLDVETISQMMHAMMDGVANGVIGIGVESKPSRYAKAALLDFARTKNGMNPLSDCCIADAQLQSIGLVDCIDEVLELPVEGERIVFDGEFAQLSYAHIILPRAETVFHRER